MSELKAKAAAARRRGMLNKHDRIRELLSKGLLPKEVAGQVGVSLNLVERIDAARPEYAQLREPFRRRKLTASVKYTDEDVLGCLRGASQALGGVLSTAAYTEFARGRSFTDGRPWPTHQTAVLRFGSWRAALDAAGLPSNPSSPIAGRRLFDEARCIDAILEVERVVGHLPGVREYEAYAAKMDGLLPSSSTIRHRFGSWQRALHRASQFASAFES
jgi:hypothetical protein